MAWEPLRTDYEDAVFEGRRKYLIIENQDNTYSFADVTNYAVKDKAFIGAKDINAMNIAMNLIMEALNAGTNLYIVFTEFFENQKILFEETANGHNDEFDGYLTELRASVMEQCENLKEAVMAQCAKLQSDYVGEITQFEKVQESVFSTWFELMKGQLSKDAAGKLQMQMNAAEYQALLDRLSVTNKTTEFQADGSILETAYDGSWSKTTEFQADGSILETYTDERYEIRKVTEFREDGTIEESYTMKERVGDQGGQA